MNLRRRNTVFIEPSFGYDGYSLYIAYFDSDKPDRVFVAKELQYDEVHSGSAVPRIPTLMLGNAEAQELMDGLYRAGMRPTQVDLNNQSSHIASLKSQVAFQETLIEKLVTMVANREAVYLSRIKDGAS